MTEIFISYSRIDSELVLRVVGELKRLGFQVWVDQFDIEPGKNWDTAIELALDRALYVLLFMSKNSVISPNVRDELDLALATNKIVVPIKLDDSELPLRIRRRQYTDFRGGYTTGMEKLVANLKHMPEISYHKNSYTTRETELDLIKKIETDPPTNTSTRFVFDQDERMPSIDGLEISSLLSHTGISSIYKARLHSGEQVLLKQRIRNPGFDIDFSQLNLNPEKFAIPTKIHEDEVYIYETMPYFEGWTLSEVITLNRDGIRGEFLNLWFEDLVSIVADLHSLNPPVIHRDIKPDNILVMPNNYRLVLLDLSSSVFYDPSVVYNKLSTPGYSAPEQLEGKPEPSSDLYSIAATFHRINTGTQPPYVLARTIRQEQFKVLSVSEKLWDTYDKLSDLDPKNRLKNAKEALEYYDSIQEISRLGSQSFNVVFPDGTTLKSSL